MGVKMLNHHILEPGHL